MGEDLVIVGDSSFAEIACEYFAAAGKYKVVGFAVDREFLHRRVLLGRPVFALDELTERHPPTRTTIFVALVYGELNRARARLVAKVRQQGYRLASYVSAQAFVWSNVVIGENCFIFENNVIQPFVRIGDAVIAWSGNHIGHHSIVGDNVFLSSHVVISGHVEVGRNCFFGVNSTVADRVIVGDDNWIGPNALITKDTPPGAMYRVDATEMARVSSHRFFRLNV